MGDYAHAGFVVVNDQGDPYEEEDMPTDIRKLTVYSVEGDNTATVHVETGIWLNIDYEEDALLTFHITLYKVN